MIPSPITEKPKTLIESLSSRQLISISIISSFILLFLVPSKDLRSGMQGFFDNPVIYFAISMIALQTAIKRRQQENEKQVQTRSNKYMLYDNIPSNVDLHIAAAIFLVSSGLLISKFDLPILPFIGIGIAILAIAGLFVRLSPAYGNSMLPKIVYGDWLITRRLLISKPKIKRGDIVSFASPAGLKFIDQYLQKLRRRRSSLPFRASLLKRVVAMPGETVRITNGTVYINDQPLQEDIPPATYEINYLGDLGNQLYKPYSEPEYATKPIIVPQNHYFLLGDLRINENIDGHVFGFVPEKQIEGRMLVLLPVAKRSIQGSALYELAKHLSTSKRLYKEKHFEALIEECDRTITFYDKCAPAFAYRGLAKKNSDQLDQAMEDCNQAISLYKKTKDPLPGFWENIGLPYAIRAIIYIHLKKYKEAIKDLDKAVKLIPDRGDFYYHRGQAYKALGDSTLANKDLAKATELGYKPENIL